MTRRARHTRGYSLIEVVIAMAVFGVFLFIVTTLTLSMRTSEKKWPVNYMKHPEVVAMIARLRKDVLDATPVYYPGSIGPYEQTPKTLLLTTITDGKSQKVVWDFSTPGEATRRVFLGEQETSKWVARGMPAQFKITLFEDFGGRPYGMRIQAVDDKGALAIDQILQPRSTLMMEERNDEDVTPASTESVPPIPPLPVPIPPTETAPPAPTDTAPPSETTTELPADGTTT